MPIADDIRLSQPTTVSGEWTPIAALLISRGEVERQLDGAQNDRDAAQCRVEVMAARIADWTRTLAKIDAAVEALKKAFPDWVGEQQKREG